MIKKAYVVGTNTKKSLSPTIFNYWFKKYKVDGVYDYVEIKEGNFKRKIKQILQTPNVCGLNITVPYKEKIIPFLSETDEHSTLIGAVNCITKVETSFLGINTDWIGFQSSILYLEKRSDNKKIEIRKNKAVVIGYGGSAKATIYALEKMGYQEVVLWNRSFHKIKNLENFGNLRIFPKKLENNNFFINEDAELVVNTIPTNNFYSKTNINLSKNYKKHIYGYDLVYNVNTNFLDFFISTNRIKGINLLVHQAAPCFEAWFKIKPEIDQGLFNLLYKKQEETKK